MRRGLLVLLLLTVAVLPSKVWGAEGYSIDNADTYQITEHSVCKLVTNALAAGKGLYVPTKYNTEWSSGAKAFINNAIIGVSLADCLDAASLRFKSASSTYLSRTGTAGNRKTFTWSAWVKRSAIAPGEMFSGYIDANNFSIITLDGNHQVQYYNLVAATGRAYITSAGVLRDPSAWYHIVVSVDATTGFGRIYINGVDQTVTGVAPGNYDSAFNTTVAQNVGRRGNGTTYFDGYVADMYLIDGQALPPSAFAETNSFTGQWIPKPYAGTYGTNGVHLTFGNAASLGADSSGGAKNWTANNFSTTVGTTYDPMIDYPSGTLPALNAAAWGNYATWNPLNASSIMGLTGGNLTATATGTAAWRSVVATIGASSGKWYWELTAGPHGGANHYMPGIAQLTFATSGVNHPGNDAVSYGYYGNTGGRYPSNVAYGAAYTTGNIIGVALDLDNGKLFFSKDGVWQNSGNPVAGTNPAVSGLTGTWQPAIGTYNGSGMTANFGQGAFIYSPPSGFKPLTTYNFLAPAINKGEDYFKTVTYTGNGIFRSIARRRNFLAAQTSQIQCCSAEQDSTLPRR